VKIKFKKLHPDAQLPAFKSADAACADVYATKDEVVPKGVTRVIKSGLAAEIPQGHSFIIRGRSGLSVNHNYHVKTGIVDADYRGDIGVIISNPDQWDDLKIKKGERIGQIMLTPCLQFEPEEADALNETERGSGGFGHTGRF